QSRSLDALQNRFTDGPCMTAIRENTVTRAGDLRDDGRWPEYGAAAVDQGVRAVLGVPFDLDEDAQAGLNVYSATPHDFDPGTVDSIVLEVEQASNALRLAVRMAHDRESHRDLRAAMEHRTVIDLAVGMIMGQNRCSQDEAVALLKTASNHRNMKLRELAAELMASVGSGPVTSSFETRWRPGRGRYRLRGGLAGGLVVHVHEKGLLSCRTPSRSPSMSTSISK